MDFIFDFWRDMLPTTSASYGDIIIYIMGILTILVMLRLIFMVPLYFLGGRKKIWVII